MTTNPDFKTWNKAYCRLPRAKREHCRRIAEQRTGRKIMPIGPVANGKVYAAMTPQERLDTIEASDNLSRARIRRRQIRRRVHMGVDTLDGVDMDDVLGEIEDVEGEVESIGKKKKRKKKKAKRKRKKSVLKEAKAAMKRKAAKKRAAKAAAKRAKAAKAQAKAQAKAGTPEAAKAQAEAQRAEAEAAQEEAQAEQEEAQADQADQEAATATDDAEVADEEAEEVEEEAATEEEPVEGVWGIIDTIGKKKGRLRKLFKRKKKGKKGKKAAAKTTTYAEDEAQTAPRQTSVSRDGIIPVAPSLSPDAGDRTAAVPSGWPTFSLPLFEQPLTFPSFTPPQGDVDGEADGIGARWKLWKKKKKKAKAATKPPAPGLTAMPASASKTFAPSGWRTVASSYLRPSLQAEEPKWVFKGYETRIHNPGFMRAYQLQVRRPWFLKWVPG